MNPIEFKDGFRIGHDQIDAEHAELIALINACIDTLNTSRGRLAFVARYDLFVENLQRHIVNEERIMRECGYEESHLEFELHHNALHLVEALSQDTKSGVSLEMIVSQTIRLVMEVILKADLPFKTHFENLVETGAYRPYAVLRSAE